METVVETSVSQRTAVGVRDAAGQHHDAIDQRPQRTGPAREPSDSNLRDRQPRVSRVEATRTEHAEKKLQARRNNLLFVREGMARLRVDAVRRSRVHHPHRLAVHPLRLLGVTVARRLSVALLLWGLAEAALLLRGRAPSTLWRTAAWVVRWLH